jgi:hypothetical protein
MTKKAIQQGKTRRKKHEERTKEGREKFNPFNLVSFLSYLRIKPEASIHGLFRQIRLFRPCVFETEATSGAEFQRTQGGLECLASPTPGPDSSHFFYGREFPTHPTWEK